jgi:glycosyltransferase involved in cell wall biosynthesis
MNNDVLISVVIPCYNAEQYIRSAIESIINQTYSNLEIILIDDGSSDATRHICLTYSQQDKRIVLLENEKNEGLIYTLNKGILAAKGDYIARMDADDRSDVNRFKVQIEYLKKNPKTDILGSNSFIIGAGNKVIKNPNHVYCEYNTLKFSALFSQPLIHGSVIAKSTVLKSNLYSQDYKHSEDFELWNRLITKGVVIENIENRLYFYRKNNEGVSQSNTDQQILSHIKASKEYLQKRVYILPSDAAIEILNNSPKSTATKDDLLEAIDCFNDLLKELDSKEVELFRGKHLFNIHIQMLKACKNDLSTFIFVLKSLLKQQSSLPNLVTWTYKLVNRRFLSRMK